MPEKKKKKGKITSLYVYGLSAPDKGSRVEQAV